MRLWSNVCVDLAVYRVGQLVLMDHQVDLDGAANTTRCEGMGLWMHQSSLTRLPPSVDQLHAEHSQLEQVVFESLSKNMSLIQSKVHQLEVSQPVTRQTIQLHDSVINRVTRLHLSEGGELYLHNTTIQNLPTQALLVGNGAHLYLSGQRELNIPHATLHLHPGSVVNVTKYLGHVNLVVDKDPAIITSNTMCLPSYYFPEVVVYMLVAMVVCLLPANVYVCISLCRRKFCHSKMDKASRTEETVQESKKHIEEKENEYEYSPLYQRTYPKQKECKNKDDSMISTTFDKIINVSKFIIGDTNTAVVEGGIACTPKDVGSNVTTAQYIEADGEGRPGATPTVVECHHKGHKANEDGSEAHSVISEGETPPSSTRPLPSLPTQPRPSSAKETTPASSTATPQQVSPKNTGIFTALTEAMVASYKYAINESNQNSSADANLNTHELTTQHDKGGDSAPVYTVVGVQPTT
ncbi:uncharacterized protein LOC121860784 isoform X2 [Homarus americanus]|nr:uncharacterized protein LOC121860784 isoform X2 [Homarus americanus]